MSPVGWIPKTSRLEEAIAEEQAKIDAAQSLRQTRQWVTEPASVIPPEAPITQTLPVSAGYQPPQLPERLPVSADYTPPQLPNMRQGQQPRQTAVMEAPTPVTPAKEFQWWEQPARVTEKVMGAVGTGITKVPFAKQILGAAAPALGWVHEKLELPFASVLTASLSPSLSWRAGESWLEHQKREYETWEAPTYIKGAVEFAMPLWWIPYFGWAGKGAKALGASEKVLKGIATTGRVVSLELPSEKVLSTLLYKRDFYKMASMWAKDKPVLHQVFQALGGQKAFVNPDSNLPEDVVRRSVMANETIRSMGQSGKTAQMYRLKNYGDPMKILDIDADGLVKTAIPPIGKSSYLNDILEHPADYKFTTPEAQAYINEWSTIRQEFGKNYLTPEGLKVSPKVHRAVSGVIDENGKFLESKWGSDPSIRRTYATQEEAVASQKAAGRQIIYDNNPNHIMDYEIDRMVNQVITKRTTETLNTLGKTALEKFENAFPEVARQITEITTKREAAKYALGSVQKMLSYKGSSIPGAVMAKIDTTLPEIATQIRAGLTLRPESVDKILVAISRELRSSLKISEKELKYMLTKSADISLAFKPFGAKPAISMSDIDIVVSQMNLSKAVKAKAITMGYRITAKENKQIFTDFMKANRDNLNSIAKEAQGQLTPLKRERSEFIRPYQGTQNIYTQERRIGAIPFINRIAKLKGKFYDDKVVTFLEKYYGDVGSKTTRSLGSVGGIMRNLIATLDASVLFIQGQLVLGRNPLLWAKTAKQTFKYVVKPQNFTKYMSDPTRQVLHNEMINAGMTVAPFEFVEAFGMIEKGLANVPKVGGVLQQGFKQTYGRAEMLFTAYGQIAKDNMWTSLRKSSMSPAELTELGRSIERMTGVMSTEVLGIGRTQRDFESAWLLFAPRYTRASFAYIGDTLKGGISGAEARKSLAGLMVSGMSMYIGVSKVTGQEPNLDPTSSRFMTVKIGDSYMGVGGTMYTMNRLLANVVATASDPETRGQLSPLNLSRVDNPFYKYLYSKTSPLTGSIVELIEQKDYFGEPFESPADWAKFLTEKVTPIAVQQTWQKGGATPLAITGSMAGLRTFPKSEWELQQDVRDEIAMREKGKPFDQLDMLDKAIINNNPEVTQFQPAIDKQTLISGKALSMEFLQRGRELDYASLIHKTTIEQLQQAYDAGVIDGVGFKEGVKNANIGYGATYEHINSNPAYKEALTKLQEPKNRQYRWELAYDKLMAGTSSNQFDDQYGQFDFNKYNKFVEDIKLEYGEADFARAMEKKNLKYAEYPPLFQEYQQAKETLKPYWAVADQVVRLFGKQYAESNRGQALITKRRKQIRNTNPALARAYEKFYSQNS